MSQLKTFPGMKLVADFGQAKILNIVVFKGALIVATSDGVYRADNPDGPYEAMTFAEVDDGAITRAFVP